MSDIRKLMEALNKIEETDLVPYVPGQGWGVRFPKMDDDEIVSMAKFAIEMAMHNNGGDKDKVFSWLDAHVRVPGEVKKKISELLGTVSEEGYKVGEPHPSVGNVPADATRLDLGGLQGLEVNRLVSSLQKLGLEQAVDYFIKSGHPSWMKNKALDYSVLELLKSYGVSEDEQLDEIIGHPAAFAAETYGLDPDLLLKFSEHTNKTHLLYEWVKTGVIDLKTFKKLLLLLSKEWGLGYEEWQLKD